MSVGFSGGGEEWKRWRREGWDRDVIFLGRSDDRVVRWEMG